MPPEPTTVMEMLGKIHTSVAVTGVKIEAMEKHLESLNGQVAKNTTFRNKGAVYVGIFAFIIPFVITYLMNL